MEQSVKNRWLLPVFIGLAVATLLFAGKRLNTATATNSLVPPPPQAGVMVVPIQLERDVYGVAMVDTVGQTIWIYQLGSRGPNYNRLKLIAAQSWKYDRLLEQYNTAEPKPEQVKALLENLGQPVEQPEEKPLEKPTKKSIEKQIETNEPNLKETDSNSIK